MFGKGGELYEYKMEDPRIDAGFTPALHVIGPLEPMTTFSAGYACCY